jgi:hypothetical protein
MITGLNNLLRAINIFYKKAGVIEVPAELQKMVEDKVLGVYYNKIFHSIAEKNFDNKERNEKLAYIKENSILFRRITNSISDLLWTSDPDPPQFERDFNYFYSALSTRQFNDISYFNVNARDKKTGFFGVYDWTKPKILSMSIVKLESGKYNFWIEINPQDNEDLQSMEVGKHKIEEKGATPLEIIDSLKGKISRDIDVIVNTFESFANYNFDIPSEEYEKSLKIIYAKYKRLSSNARSSMKDVIKIPASIIPYVGNLPGKYFSFRYVVDDASGKDYLGLWRKSYFDPEYKDDDDIYLGEMTICIKDIYLDNIFGGANIASDYAIENTILEIKNTIRHELIHLIQTAVKIAKNLKEEAGLPSKNIRQNTTKINNNLSENKEDKESKDKRPIHPLRDIEFYTRLADEINDFKVNKNEFPVPLHEDLAKFWTGLITADEFISIIKKYCIPKSYEDEDQSETNYIYMSRIVSFNKSKEFFEQLKNNQPLKYQKAVKEFMKAVL